MTSEKKSVPEILKLKNAGVRGVSTHAITHTHSHKHISKQTYVGTRELNVSEFFCTWCHKETLLFKCNPKTSHYAQYVKYCIHCSHCALSSTKLKRQRIEVLLQNVKMGESVYITHNIAHSKTRSQAYGKLANIIIAYIDMSIHLVT